MERMTYFDDVNKCYKVRPDMVGRSLVQELGVYEDIHEKDIKKAGTIGDVRKKLNPNGPKLSEYWEE